MGSKIKDITSRLEQLCQDRIELGLQRIAGGASSPTAAAHQRPPSSSVPTEREVFGREEDKAKILDMVLTDTPSDHANFVVIPIVGKGGIGKTTLAREVYNDKAVEDSKFDVKAWVCVSDVFDILGISKALLESITRRPCLLNNLNEVQVELKVAVDKKRFLLVLDDVWNEDYSLWVDLKAPFLAAAPNSKMIVTTRNSNVASIMGPIEHYNLKRLVRHSSYARGRLDGKSKFEVFNEIEHLRTFLPLCIRGGVTSGYITSMVLYDLLPKFKMLRMLSLQGYRIGELPIPFEDLRLLRFLNLADTDIRSLPESTCALLNLEILILRNCSPTAQNDELDQYSSSRYKRCKFVEGDAIRNERVEEASNIVQFHRGQGRNCIWFGRFRKFKLCIAGLENVNNPQNAREAALCEKLNLHALTLEWGSQFDNSRDVAVEEHVLDILQPHKCIKKVAIRNYGGARFPLWIGDPLFSKIEFLELENCNNCVSLPSLGLLSSLKHLAVKGMKKLKSIESEVYGEGFSMPFPSLKILQLSVVKCPKLSGKLPELLPSLEILVVSKCEKCKLPSSLKRIEIENCEKLQRLFDDKDDASSSSPSSSSSQVMLQHLSIKNCPALSSLSSGIQLLESLEELVITNCRKLESIPDGLHNLNCLQKITLVSCPSLVSFPERGLPNAISWVDISYCDKLEALPNDMHKLNSLQTLSIIQCPKLESFPEEGFPTNLRTLKIGNFKIGFPKTHVSSIFEDMELPKSHVCKRDQGKEWPKIAHIPWVVMDGKFIYDPELEV
ncbi:hypothetical protein CUMW_224740 [Citrus unshiu]|uniref:Uncharacterized protein n=1 Tax=Citrus unshiu TaxID=55188 RepID=A0A2H5QFD3_CITUN|nr:hypothetical protein CUMW_224740 [Citrus unshiu]